MATTSQRTKEASEDQTTLAAVTQDAESGCSHGVENCPGPDSEISIKDGKAVIDGTIPCVKCYMESLNDCEYGDLE